VGIHTAQQKIDSIKWILNVLKHAGNLQYREGSEYISGCKAIHEIGLAAREAHYDDEIKELDRLLRAIKRL
jgi:hypothetical protein